MHTGENIGQDDPCKQKKRNDFHLKINYENYTTQHNRQERFSPKSSARKKNKHNVRKQAPKSIKVFLKALSTTPAEKITIVKIETFAC